MFPFDHAYHNVLYLATHCVLYMLCLSHHHLCHLSRKVKISNIVWTLNRKVNAVFSIDYSNSINNTELHSVRLWYNFHQNLYTTHHTDILEHRGRDPMIMTLYSKTHRYCATVCMVLWPLSPSHCFWFPWLWRIEDISWHHIIPNHKLITDWKICWHGTLQSTQNIPSRICILSTNHTDSRTILFYQP